MNKIGTLLLNVDEEVFDYIDIELFAKWLLIHNILGTSDAEGSNMYFVKKIEILLSYMLDQLGISIHLFQMLMMN